MQNEEEGTRYNEIVAADAPASSEYHDARHIVFSFHSLRFPFKYTDPPHRRAPKWPTNFKDNDEYNSSSSFLRRFLEEPAKKSIRRDTEVEKEEDSLFSSNSSSEEPLRR